MKIYYVIVDNKQYGCLNHYKMEQMYPHFKLYECDIDKFTGHLHNEEWLG